ncbi:GGDEF domain-containing protein [Massilia agri]|uniref:diguanylate cyclase n=1 Tax=Massilia agri TaxID=1886785 RepID=A0ABT2ARK8_9BURK|nr:GGDEF domain-containing protein [Massilia agri]
MPRPPVSGHLAIDLLRAEFTDRLLETAHLEAQLPRTRRQLAFTLLFCSLYFLCFFATDVAALGIVPDTALLLGARLLVAACAWSCAWLVWRRRPGVKASRLAATVAESVALGCFMVIALHRPGEFHWHAMSLAIMLLVIYLFIPNRLATALAIAAAATAVFLGLTLAYAGMDFADLLTMCMLLALVNTFGALAARRYQLATREEYRARLVLEDAAERDWLTGCHNRRCLHDVLLDTAQARGHAGQPLSVILCDIDHFKRINDSHGHGAGDAVLVDFSKLLQAVAREGVDSVIRYGGEEFLLVLPGTSLSAGVQLAEWLRQRCAAMPVQGHADGATIYTTASFGVASCADGDTPLLELIDAADKLMYTAKRNGRDRVESLLLAAPLPKAA